MNYLQSISHWDTTQAKRATEIFHLLPHSSSPDYSNNLNESAEGSAQELLDSVKIDRRQLKDRKILRGETSSLDSIPENHIPADFKHRILKFKNNRKPYAEELLNEIKTNKRYKK